jgi:hypothetical protein
VKCAAPQSATPGRRIADGCNEATDFFPRFTVPRESDRYLKELPA